MSEQSRQTTLEREQVRIGTIVTAREAAPELIAALIPHGFESFQLAFSADFSGLDLAVHAERVLAALGDSGAVVSALGVYGNPLANAGTRDAFADAIRSVRRFGSDLVCGFTGRVPGASIPESLDRFREVFGPLAQLARDEGVRIAFENCPQGGTWATGDHNIAHNPAAWELIFDAVPEDNLGLEWEPCHQMCQLIDPMPQLRRWAGRIFHVHGKDATILTDVLREFGAYGRERFAHHRFPGFGDSNWTDIISELRIAGFRGAIDIEGRHDRYYSGELEMTAQLRSLRYLIECRGGCFTPNPPGMV